METSAGLGPLHRPLQGPIHARYGCAGSDGRGGERPAADRWLDRRFAFGPGATDGAPHRAVPIAAALLAGLLPAVEPPHLAGLLPCAGDRGDAQGCALFLDALDPDWCRSEEHTSELQSQ